MARWSMWVFVAMIAVAGCATARVVDGDVVGPNGEHLVKLECQYLEQCTELARETCAGDFDVVNNAVVWGPSSRTPPGSTDAMLVRCRPAPGTAPPSQPAAPRGGSK